MCQNRGLPAKHDHVNAITCPLAISPLQRAWSMVAVLRLGATRHYSPLLCMLDHANRTRRRPESGALQVRPAPKEILTSMSLLLCLVPEHRVCGQVKYFPSATKCMSLWLAGLSSSCECLGFKLEIAWMFSSAVFSLQQCNVLIHIFVSHTQLLISQHMITYMRNSFEI